jgi:hypothetical protein
MKKYISICALILLTGCASVSTGSDPIVVRAQQTESVGYATIDTFLAIDNANRAFFMSNAPAFHSYAEWLRAPQIVNSTNVYPRGIAFMLSLDSVVQQYQAGTVNSNQVANVLATAETAITQAQYYIASASAGALTNAVIANAVSATNSITKK